MYGVMLCSFGFPGQAGIFKEVFARGVLKKPNLFIYERTGAATLFGQAWEVHCLPKRLA